MDLPRSVRAGANLTPMNAPPILWVDFETRSRCDLRVAGVYNYAGHASTEVLCMSYAFDGGDVVTWRPEDGPLPVEVATHTGPIRAHNAAFERLIFHCVLERDFKPDQFYCTAAQARANCAPGSLEDVGRFAGAGMRKDPRGAQLIRRLCVPRANGTFSEDAALMAELIDYCEQDVRAMRAISHAMRQLTDEELLDYHINERVNDRGVLVDRPLSEAATRYADAELAEIQARVREVTAGAVPTVRSPRMCAWVWDRVGPAAQTLMTVDRKGVEGRGIDKSIRANLLALADENPDEVPADVSEVIQCADDLWASSVAKFTRIGQLSDDVDGRLRGAFVFNGAAATGRASSFGAQIHNLTRQCSKMPDETRQAMVRGHAIVPAYGTRVTDVLKGMLRPALLAAPGHSLVVADWVGIEARVNPWASNEPSSEVVMDMFRAGVDRYKAAAAAMLGCSISEITAPQRQVGKVSELACGYGGGPNAFAAMGRVYGVKVSDSQARGIVTAWRRVNPWAVAYWQAVSSAAARAMRNRDTDFSAGAVTYMFDGQHLWYSLPSGRVLCYPYAKTDGAEGISYAKAAWKPAAGADEWPRARLWHGIMVENIAQAISNDVLRLALRRLDAAGLRAVLHVHDEIVVECPTEDVAQVTATMTDAMCSPPAWASRLPLDVEIKAMTRYGK